MDKNENIFVKVQKLSTNLTKDEILVCYFDFEKCNMDYLETIANKLVERLPNVPILFLDKNFEMTVETKEKMIKFLKGENNE